MGKSKLSLLAALLLTVLCQLASAEPNTGLATPLDCLSRAKGRVLVWDALWDTAGTDDGVQYRVLEVSTRYTYPVRSQSVSLVLSSTDAATRPFRKLNIGEELAAARVCSRLQDHARVVKADTVQVPAAPQTASEKPDITLPFITYSADGWVRAETPGNANFAVCRVLLRPFLCTAEEREIYGAKLYELGEVLLSQRRHP